MLKLRKKIATRRDIMTEKSYEISTIFGFECINFKFENKNARIILPNTEKNGRWVIKTEYADAFMDTEIELLNRGYCCAFIENDSRWGVKADIERKQRFIEFIIKEYNLNNKCALVGMSCGGLMAIKQAVYKSDNICCLYLDAPVLNYMSCPCGFGVGEALGGGAFIGEILNDLNMKSISELLIYRDAPMHNIEKLIETKIPIILVAGDSDKVVPYCENGIMLSNEYKNTDIPFYVYIKEGCDHHPHGHTDVKVTADFIDKAYSC